MKLTYVTGGTTYTIFSIRGIAESPSVVQIRDPVGQLHTFTGIEQLACEKGHSVIATWLLKHPSCFGKCAVLTNTDTSLSWFNSSLIKNELTINPLYLILINICQFSLAIGTMGTWGCIPAIVALAGTLRLWDQWSDRATKEFINFYFSLI